MKLSVTAPTMSVERLVVRPAVWVYEGEPITRAAGAMREANVSALLVRPGLGIVTGGT